MRNRRVLAVLALLASMVAPAALAAPAVDGARLVDPGFEGPYAPVSSSNPNVSGDIAQGWSDNSPNATVHYARDETVRHGGNASQRVEVTAVSGGDAQLYQAVAVRAGRLYDPGVWLRGTPGTRVRLLAVLAHAPWTYYGDSPAYLSNQWTFVSLPLRLANDDAVTLLLDTPAATTYWVDDAAFTGQVDAVTPDSGGTIPASQFGMHVGDYLQSQGPANLGLESPYFPVSAAGGTISGQLAAHWIDNSEWAQLHVQYSRTASSPHGGQSAQRVRIADITNGQVQTAQLLQLTRGQTYTTSVWLRGTAGMTIGYSLRQWPSPYTNYAVQTITATGRWQQITLTGKVTANGPTALMVLGQSPGTFDFDDVTLTDSAGDPVRLGLPWPSVPIGTWRTWDQDVTWARLEPRRGQWDFTSLDKGVHDALAHHSKIILTLGQSPTWASARPNESSYYGAGAAAEPRNINDWITYVRTVATRYHGQIDEFEIWNEPNDENYFSGDIDAMLRLAHTAYDTVKAVDPDSTVITPAAYSPGWLEQFLRRGGGAWADVIGYHVYDGDTAPEADAATLDTLRAIRDNAGLDQPIWITEGADGTTATDPADGAALLARKFLVQRLYGARLFAWYAWGAATSFCLGTTTGDGVTINAAGRAYAVLQAWLVGARVLSLRTAGGIWAVRLARADGSTAYVVWSPGGAASWTPPSGFTPTTAEDLSGTDSPVGGGPVAVTDAPVLLTG